MGRSRSRSIERRGSISFDYGSLPKLLLLVLTWTAQETFCNPVQGSQIIKELNTDPVDVDKFRQDSLTAHNNYRAKHGVAALKLNAELNALAQDQAQGAVDSWYSEIK